MSPETAVVLAPVLGAFAGAFTGWLAAERKATLERLNQAALAATNYEYSKGLQEHSQFIAKKHDVVPELHKLLVDAHSTILNIALGRLMKPELNVANVRDVQKFMDEEQVLLGVQEKVVALWDTDRRQASEILLGTLAEFQKELALRSLIKARNYLLNHQLYVSASTFDLAKEWLEHLERQLWWIKRPADLTPAELTPVDRPRIFALQKEVSAMLSRELNPDAPAGGMSPLSARPLPAPAAKGPRSEG